MFHFHVYGKSLCVYFQRALKNLYKVNLILQDGSTVDQSFSGLIKVPVKALDITWGNDNRFWQQIDLTDHDTQWEFSLHRIILWEISPIYFWWQASLLEHDDIIFWLSGRSDSRKVCCSFRWIGLKSKEIWISLPLRTQNMKYIIWSSSGLMHLVGIQLLSSSRWDTKEKRHTVTLWYWSPTERNMMCGMKFQVVNSQLHQRTLWMLNLVSLKLTVTGGRVVWFLEELRLRQNQVDEMPFVEDLEVASKIYMLGLLWVFMIKIYIKLYGFIVAV